MIISNFYDLNEAELINVDGGTFFGVCQGICVCAVGTAGVVGGVIASSAGIGVPAVIFGAATYIDGITIIASNM